MRIVRQYTVTIFDEEREDGALDVEVARGGDPILELHRVALIPATEAIGRAMAEDYDRAAPEAPALASLRRGLRGSGYGRPKITLDKRI